MTLTDKLRVRAGTLWWIYGAIKPSMWIIIYMLISAYKFYHYGLQMYVEEHFPEKMYLQEMVRIFLDRSIWPIIWWVPVAALLERALLSPIWEKYVVSRAKD